MSHLHERVQYATAPALRCIGMERFDSATGEYVPYDEDDGWTTYIRIWKSGTTVPIVDALAAQDEVGEAHYLPTADAMSGYGDFRFVFWARDEDGNVDVFPVQTLKIQPVAGGALVVP